MATSADMEALRRATGEFESALADAVPAHELAQFHLFAERDEKFIRKEVERLLYEPELPCGGRRERKWIERMKATKKKIEGTLQPGEYFWASALVRESIEKWEAVCPPMFREGLSGLAPGFTSTGLRV